MTEQKGNDKTLLGMKLTISAEDMYDILEMIAGRERGWVCEMTTFSIHANEHIKNGAYVVQDGDYEVIDVGCTAKPAPEPEVSDKPEPEPEPEVSDKPEPEPEPEKEKITYKKHKRKGHDPSKHCLKGGYSFCGKGELDVEPGEVMLCTCGRIVTITKRGDFGMVPTHYTNKVMMEGRLRATYRRDQRQIRETMGKLLRKLEDYC